MKYIVFLNMVLIGLNPINLFSNNRADPIINVNKNEFLSLEKINIDIYFPKNVNNFDHWEFKIIGKNKYYIDGVINNMNRIIPIEYRLTKAGNHLLVLELNDINGDVKTITKNIYVKSIWKSNLLVILALPIIISLIFNLLFSKFLLYFSLKDQITESSKSLYKSIIEKPSKPRDFILPDTINTLYNLYAPVTKYKKLKAKADILNRGFLQYKTKSYSAAKDELEKILSKQV